MGPYHPTAAPSRTPRCRIVARDEDHSSCARVGHSGGDCDVLSFLQLRRRFRRRPTRAERDRKSQAEMKFSTQVRDRAYSLKVRCDNGHQQNAGRPSVGTRSNLRGDRRVGTSDYWTRKATGEATQVADRSEAPREAQGQQEQAEGRITDRAGCSYFEALMVLSAFLRVVTTDIIAYRVGNRANTFTPV